jgi:hypothetical protein
MSCRRGRDGDLDVHVSDGVRILGPHLDESPRLGGRLLEHLGRFVPSGLPDVAAGRRRQAPLRAF